MRMAIPQEHPVRARIAVPTAASDSTTEARMATPGLAVPGRDLGTSAIPVPALRLPAALVRILRPARRCRTILNSKNLGDTQACGGSRYLHCAVLADALVCLGRGADDAELAINR